MRLILTLLPAIALAQTPSTPTPAKSAAPAKKAATTTPKPAAATGTGAPAAPKPAATAGRGGRGATAPKPAAPVVKPLATDDEKTVYALGQSIGQSISMFNLSPSELEILSRAIADATVGKHEVELSEWGPKIDGLMRSRAGAAAEKEKAASAAYLAKAVAEPGAVKTESGIVYKELKVGTGASPAATDNVKVHYRGTLTNGTEFDSSYKRNEPAQFPLNGVIKCWTEGVQRMKVGGKSQLVCPSDLAYGDQGRPPQIPGGATLVFEVELLDIVK
jgi:FKBP-type peptidyl-prolyl cis-trans isomerase FkpA